ncbi:hypothetical protein [Micromonospora okii]|uniref:hypothetical protein n=1 Tax=Micromonospora okii TaxID=1182970 RepID=UPI001E363C16|nr:hypothetical protein [Micromonospora okii]
MTDLRAGTLLHVTRAASVQFLRPIFFRLIRVHTDWHTYHGWVWLDGYEVDARGEAVARRSIFVRPDGLRVLAPSALTLPRRPSGRPRRPAGKPTPNP